MKWTKEKPSENGIYFHRPESGLVDAIRVWAGPKKFRGTLDNRLYDFDLLDGHFYGPVEPPPFEDKEAERKTPAILARPDSCHADRDGECWWSECPQLRDGEPERSGRHCPLDRDDEDY